MKRLHQENEATVLTQEEKFGLIEAVERFPALWDDRSRDYKDLNARNDAWRSIVTDMEIDYGRRFSRHILQNTFKNLKDSFARKQREHRSALARTSGAQAGTLEQVTRWPYYDALKFLTTSTDPG
ncbi:hypothetical protein ANCDUO_05191 [Ancylostoma duodenale]|uniref:MADF domain-containing protein n=1 Tax=Ancylostoma duodenale TaxID=51022 RepID=A0A0C2DP91_9BILA|nr:hypothetical protein ANCDUO_05191 [Ancylostoma duodenale]